MKRTTLAALTATSLLAIMLASPAAAQSSDTVQAEPAPGEPSLLPTNQAGNTDEDGTIVVTGTQIRGIAPVGSNVVSLSEQDIQATGATNTQQLLASLPQTASFNNLAATLPGQGNPLGVTRVPIARPNIRKLPGCAGAGTGACTLILLDGHRLVPAGNEQTAVDPNIIPPGIIQRVETILDGNSAIYGSDAIGGVINFITRKRFDGLRVDGRYGMADNYRSIDANITGGVDWGSGSLIATYSYGHNDALFGRDRDYVKSINWTTGQITSAGQAHLQCDMANATVAGQIFAAPTLAPGSNICDPSLAASLYPMQTRHTGYASLSQDIGDSLVFDVNGFYSKFRTTAVTGPLVGSATLRSTNPFYRQIPGTPAGESYTALFSYGPVFGDDSGTQEISIESWQVTPTLTANLGGDWQVRALGAYGWSKTASSVHSIDTPAQTAATGLGATTPATALNPLDIAATDPAILANIGDFYSKADGINKFTNARVVGDGPLFDLPGGAVRASVGIEYMKNDFRRRTTNAATQLYTPYIQGSVESEAAFGELFVPIVGEQNATPGIHRLDLSASARYDHYDQGVGGTFNPKFALTYEPVSWLTLRGNWGKSFNAPTAADRVGEQLNTVSAVPCPITGPCSFVPTGTALNPGVKYILFISGTAPNLKPQKATNWALGFDVRPPFAPDLKLSLTYYNIIIKGFIALPQIGSDIQQAFRDFPELNQVFAAGLPVTDPRVIAFANQAPASGPAALQAILAAGGSIVQLGPDNRVRNLGLFKIGGLDFTATYRHDTGFGSVDARISGNYQLRRDFAPHPGDPFQDTMFTEGVPVFTSATQVGANIGKARVQATWNHTSGYKFLTVPGINLDDRVGNFDTIDLFARYDFKGEGLTSDLAVTLNVTNLFDADPPIYRTTNGTNNGFAPNIRTLGRVFLVGLEKAF